MKFLFSLLISVASLVVIAQPVLPVSGDEPRTEDWLIHPVKEKAGIYKSASGKNIILYNGLVKRTFRIAPNVACIEYKNMITGQQLLRSVKPEAKVTINNIEYNVGGLQGQTENAYLLEKWVDGFTPGKYDFRMTGYRVDTISPYLHWKARAWSPVLPAPSGKKIIFTYRSSLTELKEVSILVTYELYDGIPVMVKYVTIMNGSAGLIRINRVVNEIIGIVEEESAVVGTPAQMKKQQGIYSESNYAFNNAMSYEISDQTTHWTTDSSYTSQVNYYLQTPAVLEIYPEKVTDVALNAGDTLFSVRTYELMMDSYDRIRRGLLKKKMYRAIAPWTNQNPIFMHLVSKSDEEVKSAVDQCVATGYEAVILSFGSHLNMEDSSEENFRRWKQLATYAHSKNILIGGYSLFSSRTISEQDDVIDSATGNPGGAFFGHAPCYGSKWGLAYQHQIVRFFDKTSFDIWENDGPYPGDRCASKTHPGHEGLGDSQWKQAEIQKALYHQLNERGIYINAPDWYFLDGTNKIAIGYRELNFSLSREQQKILNRQNIYDGTLEKTASMSWGFVPLTKYQGGGPEAVLEPLNAHLKDYEQLMVQYYGAGVQACYRGPRLYDTDSTRQLVARTITWYKRYRDILNADMIPLRRADGRDWDGMLHVSPNLKQKGMLMLYNPTKEKITRTIRLPLHYTGLAATASISERGAGSKTYRLSRDYTVPFTLSIGPESYTWFVIE